MRVRKLYQCGNCNGEGILDDYAFSSNPTVCPECEGSGQLLVHPSLALGLLCIEKAPQADGEKPKRSKPKGVQPSE